MRRDMQASGRLSLNEANLNPILNMDICERARAPMAETSRDEPFENFFSRIATRLDDLPFADHQTPAGESK